MGKGRELPDLSVRRRSASPEDAAAIERFAAGAQPSADGSNHPQPSAAIPPAPKPARAAAGTATLIQRQGRTVRRLQVYLPPAVADELDAFAALEQRQLSGVVAAALGAYFAAEAKRRGGRSW